MSLFISSPEHFLDLNNARLNMDGMAGWEQRGGGDGEPGMFHQSAPARVGGEGEQGEHRRPDTEVSGGKGWVPGR